MKRGWLGIGEMLRFDLVTMHFEGAPDDLTVGRYRLGNRRRPILQPYHPVSTARQHDFETLLAHELSVSRR